MIAKILQDLLAKIIPVIIPKLKVFASWLIVTGNVITRLCAYVDQTIADIINGKIITQPV